MTINYPTTTPPPVFHTGTIKIS